MVHVSLYSLPPCCVCLFPRFLFFILLLACATGVLARATNTGFGESSVISSESRSNGSVATFDTSNRGCFVGSFCTDLASIIPSYCSTLCSDDIIGCNGFVCSQNAFGLSLESSFILNYCKDPPEFEFSVLQYSVSFQVGGTGRKLVKIPGLSSSFGGLFLILDNVVVTAGKLKGTISIGPCVSETCIVSLKIVELNVIVPFCTGGVKSFFISYGPIIGGVIGGVLLITFLVYLYKRGCLNPSESNVTKSNLELPQFVPVYVVNGAVTTSNGASVAPNLVPTA